MAPQMECESLSDAQLIELIAKDTIYLKCVSYRTRDYCMGFMRRMVSNINEGYLTDIYHDALIVLYEKARTGEFRLTSSLQTYLNSVCRNQLLLFLKKDGNTLPLPWGQGELPGSENEMYVETITDRLHTDDIGINNERVQAIMQSLEYMKGKGDCYELLMLVHYKGRSMKEVAAHFGYKNEQIARNKNYLCRDQLKTLTFRALRKLEK